MQEAASSGMADMPVRICGLRQKSAPSSVRSLRSAAILGLALFVLLRVQDLGWVLSFSSLQLPRGLRPGSKHARSSRSSCRGSGSDEVATVEPQVEQVVTPWEVEAGEDGVDYAKLIEQFGCEPITQEQIDRIERLTGKPPHRFLRRGLFFAHRDLNLILDTYEKGQPFFIYTGRGPSSESMHLGHLVPFLFTKWLQDVFDVPLVIELTDDEKFLFKDGLSLEEARRMGFENARDIIAVGFDPAKTFIFRDTDYIRQLYPVALEIQKRITLSQAQAAFGFQRSDNIGKFAFAAIQASPSFAQAFPSFLKPGMRCFIPQAIDQDPYFRLCRGVAGRMKWPKPALIHSKFLPALQGSQTKMSASVASTALYLTDKPKQLRKKINKHAFSGGGATLEEQREKGANLAIDVAYQYLRIWMEDDKELEEIGQEYAAGRMLTGEVKKRLGDVLEEIVKEHQAARAKVDDQMVWRFMDPERAELQGRWSSS
mmetsp:Transcript_31141/g.72508  ORF Transcript_31141/g.72508 Transcript_31141/m.72508 type:complete len:484 (+) Transcript_31141:72-1523(+)